MIHIRSPITDDLALEALCGLPLGLWVYYMDIRRVEDVPMPGPATDDLRCPACWAAWRRGPTAEEPDHAR